MIPKELIISDADFFGDRVDALGEALGDRFGDALGDASGDALGDRFGDALGDRFGDALGDRFGDVLGDALGDAILSRETERVWCVFASIYLLNKIKAVNWLFYYELHAVHQQRHV